MSNKFSKLTVNGITYKIEDNTKLNKPTVEGTEGQILTYTANGPVWADTKNSIIDETPDYSSFEVMPNKNTIPAGTEDTVTGLIYNAEIPACTIHKMTLRSCQEPADCDVVIDWGDGIVETIKDGQYTGHTVGKSYELSHDYASAMTADIQRFIVKIYGKNYYTFRHNSYQQNNLISRIFACDLPMASHVVNFSSIAISATRLLTVTFPHSTPPYTAVQKWGGCFSGCSNLLSAKGFEDILVNSDAEVPHIFNSCINLQETDLRLPGNSQNISYAFYNCKNLAKDISSLIPLAGFSVNKINPLLVFYGMEKLTGTIDPAVFWDNKSVQWTFDELGYNHAFERCDYTIRKQVPLSWGGVASDDIINIPISDITAGSGITVEVAEGERIISVDATVADKTYVSTEIAKLEDIYAKTTTIYTKAEIDNKGFLTEETDPTVPAWAKSENKPVYTYSEIVDTPDLTVFVKNNTITELQTTISSKAEKVHRHEVSDIDELSVTLNTFAKSAEVYTKAEVDNKVSAIYRPKGAVASFNSLPVSNNIVGDTYTVLDTGAEYAYTVDGTWEYIGEKVDLTPYAKAAELSIVAKSGSYNDLADKPTIPTTTSELTNNSDFVTKTYVDNQLGDISSLLDTINGEEI